MTMMPNTNTNQLRRHTHHPGDQPGGYSNVYVVTLMACMYLLPEALNRLVAKLDTCLAEEKIIKGSKERKELHDFLPYLKNLSVLQGPTVNFIAQNWYAHKQMITILMKTISSKTTMNGMQMTKLH